MKRPFPVSTARRWVPGVGYTLTRANLAHMLKLKLIEPSSSPAEVAKAAQGLGKEGRAEPRHVGRAWRLMTKPDAEEVPSVPPNPGVRPVEVVEPAAARS